MRALAEETGGGIDRAIDDALGEIGRFCGVDRAYVFRFRAGGTRLDNTHEWCAEGISAEIDNLQDVPAEVAPSWLEAFGRDEYVFIGAVAEIGDDEAELREILAAQSIRSLLVNPLRAGGELIGFMGFDYVTEASALSWVDLDVLLTISENVAAAIARHEAEDRLRMAEQHDPVTGLPNRSAFTEMLQETIDAMRAGRAIDLVGDGTPPDGTERRRWAEGSRVMVGLVDIDRFSEVNTAFGFSAGDEAIRQIAQRIDANTRPQDCVARIGSDEFAVTVGAGDHDETPTDLARRLHALLVEPLELRGRRVRITASIGVSVDRGRIALASELLHEAEAALREAKEGGGDAAVVFDEEVGARMARRHHLADALHQDDMLEHLTVVYQPTVDLATGAILGAEALARWDAPSTGPVTPDQFIGVAETTGVIGVLSEEIIARALRDARERFLPLVPDFRISINLSVGHVAESDFVDRLEAIIDASGYPRSGICFEITESVVTRDTTVLDAIRELRSRGVEIELDDFGTGYSSFARLRDLPFTGIKIDRSFVSGIEHDEIAQSLVAAQADIAASLGLSVLAEGVETDAERDTLLALEVTVGQGFGLHRPMFVDDLAALLANPGDA
jgi:diguanylate cyclase (GGDEF)-like protein